jgi:outer membrane phospholipase A
MSSARSPKRAVGTRAEVMHGSAHHTSGGLTQADLKYNRWGRIVSKAASAQGKQQMAWLRREGLAAEPYSK